MRINLTGLHVVDWDGFGSRVDTLFTVMKRQQDSELIPRSKRRGSSYISREDYNEYDYMHAGGDGDRRERRPMVVRDGKVPRDQRDRERRDIDTSHIIKRHKTERVIGEHAPRQDRSSGVEYKTLVLSNIHEQAPDHMVCEVIEDEFKRFGEFNVKLVYNGDHRVAYVNFRYPENARSAKHTRAKLMLYDRPMSVDSVCPKRSFSSSVSDISEGYSGRDGYYQQGALSVRSGAASRRVRQDSFGSDGHRSDFQQFDNRQQSRPNQAQGDLQRERFPHHLHHILPEDDEKATRTLFVGNLDPATADEDLLAIFERYGVVEDIDIKRPPKVQGNAYAFVKFANLDMAHRAKVDMSGELIGNFQCKIGYGKAHPSTCLWVGGIGPWIRPESLEREFDRFGVIHRIEWPQGKNYAYILYDNTDAAQAACQQMRGTPLGGPDRRLRIDFTDPAHIDRPPTKNGPLRKEETSDPVVMGAPGFNERRENPDNWQGKGGFGDRARGGPRKPWGNNNAMFDGDYPERARNDMNDQMGESDKHKGNRRVPGNWSNGADHGPNSGYGRGNQAWGAENGDNNKRDRPPGSRPGNASPASSHGNRPAQGENGNVMHLGNPGTVENVSDLAKCLPVVWSGALILKNNAFATRMHLLSGDVAVVDNLMRDPTSTEMPVLRIAQRLRLDQPMLEDVSKRVLAAAHNGGQSVLLAMPGSTQTVEESNTNVQQRPLRNLMSYLKQKEAAGVVALPPNTNGKDEKDCGKLYACPPCAFSHKFLAKQAPKLGNEPAKDDHLVVVVVKND